MNSHSLVPENEINPYVNHSSITPFVDSYNYRPPGSFYCIPRNTYNYVTTSNSVSVIDQKKYQNNVNRIIPAQFFQNTF